MKDFALGAAGFAWGRRFLMKEERGRERQADVKYFL
jgi:hypothetical protein